MFAASKTSKGAAGTPPPASDPQFNYVTMLLHGDGTNGAQNNTFVDTSSNAFTVTRNGNATQGTNNPYGNNWSNYFDGSSSGITAAPNTAFDVGSGDFTLECWVYNSEVSAQVGIAGVWNGSYIIWRAGTVYRFYFGGIAGSPLTCSIAAVAGIWTHLAIVRNGVTLTFYVNGVSGGTASLGTSAITATSNPFGVGANFEFGSIGYPFTGYIKDVRLVKGTAVYTSAFTPPTTPLTAISGTSILACQNSYFKDNSSNNFQFTVWGTPFPSTFAPYSSGAAYSTSVNGGSAYFPGSSTDKLTFGTNTAFNVGTGDFTVAFWGYWNSVSSSSFPYKPAEVFHGGANNTLAIWIDGTSAQIAQNANGAVLQATVTSPVKRWTHYAFTRSGTTGYIFMNGVLITSGAVSTNFTNPSNLTLGAGPNGYTDGYIAGFQFLKGTALYTSSFTPPTTPPTNVTNTSLLLNFTNGGIFDNSANIDLQTVGNAQISTSVKKYGTGSMAFDGTGDWLIAPDSINLQFGSSSFTIECWVYLSSTGVAQGLIAKGSSTTGWLLSVNSSNQVSFTDTSTAITSTGALSASTWYYIAVVRTGTSTNQTKIYINGTNDGTGTSATTFNQTNSLYVGADRTGGSNLNGYIDDLRITNGVARYTANFTPPTAAFPDY